MKKITYFLVLTCLAIIQGVYAASVSIDEKNGLVTIYDFVYDFTCSSGSDNVEVCYPSDWSTSTGTDGRKVAYPYDWFTTSGTDGRKVAYPYDWFTTSGTDGRKVVYPYDWGTSTGTDGRKVAYPLSWSKEEGKLGMKITGNKIELIFGEAQYLPLFEKYREVFNSDEKLADFIMYTFLSKAYENNIIISLSSNSSVIPSPNINYGNTPNPVNELDELINSFNNNVCGINSTKNSIGTCYCDAGYVWVYPDDKTNYDCKLITVDNSNNANSITAPSEETTPIVAANMLGIFGYITLRDTEEEYQLESKILRQEIIGIAIKLKGITLPENYSCNDKFKDVTHSKPNNWVCRVAEVSAENGIISSENTLFNPEINVSLAEALAMILNSLNKPYQGYKNNSDLFNPKAVDWQKSVLSYAQHNGIIASTFVNPNLPVNRGDVFLMIAKALGW